MRYLKEEKRIKNVTSSGWLQILMISYSKFYENISLDVFYSISMCKWVYQITVKSFIIPVLIHNHNKLNNIFKIAQISVFFNHYFTILESLLIPLIRLNHLCIVWQTQTFIFHGSNFLKIQQYHKNWCRKSLNNFIEQYNTLSNSLHKKYAYSLSTSWSL